MDNDKEGKGTLTYVNGDKIVGSFMHGQAHGNVEYKFANGKSRYAVYCRGSRSHWFDKALEKAHAKALRAMQWLEASAREEALLRELDTNTRLIKAPVINKK